MLSAVSFPAESAPVAIPASPPSSFLVLSPVLSGRARADSVSSAFSLPGLDPGQPPAERRRSSTSSTGSGSSAAGGAARFLRLNPVINGRDEPIEEDEEEK